MAAAFSRSRASITIAVTNGSIFPPERFESGYMVSIRALPKDLQVSTNSEALAVVRNYLQRELGVPPEAGFIHIASVPAGNSFWNGKMDATVIDEGEENQGKTQGRQSPVTTVRGVKPKGKLRRIWSRTLSKTGSALHSMNRPFPSKWTRRPVPPEEASPADARATDAERSR